MKVLGVLWHSTGANNPQLRRYVQPSDDDPNREELLRILGVNKNRNDWNHVSVGAGLNCWIGKLADGTVATVQTMPWDFRPWGCGHGKKGSCNSGWIQFEMAEDSLNDPVYFGAVYREACEITAYLCKLYGIAPHGTVRVNGADIPTILCHHDSYVLGFGSGHVDVTHWFPRFGKSMETARDDVAALLAADKEDEDVSFEKFMEYMNQYRGSIQDNDSGTWSQEARDWAVRTGMVAGMGTLPTGEPNYAWEDFLTREQMAMLLYRFAQMMGKAS